MQTITPARQQLITFARSIEDLSAPSDEFVKMVAPWEWDNLRPMAFAIANLSCCALVLHAIYQRCLNLPPKPKYRISMAPLDVINLAKAANACTANPKQWPKPGDGVMVGKSATAVEHFGFVVSAQTAAPDARACGFERIDGGQKNQLGHQTVKLMWRPFHYSADGHMTEDGTNRPVVMLIDGDKMAAHYGLRVG